MLRSRRFALVATAAIIGLSACGNAGDTTSVGKTPAVIVLGSGSGSKVAGPNVATGEAAGDMMIAPWSVNYEWVGGAYPDLGTAAPSWSLPAGTTVDEAVVAKLAAALGVSGDVRTLSADLGGGWMVGPADYSGPTVQVSKDGLLSWWYNGPVTQVKDSTGCAAPGSGGGTDAAASGDTVAPPAPDVVVEPCRVDEPVPPTNVPDKAGAEAATKAFLADIGLDASQFEFTTYADQWGASTTAWLRLGGHRSPISMNVGFGENGTITWASGSLATPQAGAEYPIVGPAEALTRLQDQTGKWFAYGGGIGMAGARGVLADSAVNTAVDTVTASGEGSAPAVGAPEVAPAPLTSDSVLVDPMPTPEPVTVQLNDVRLDLTMVWAADGTVWLLPAYTFTSADGGEYTVIAVEDQFVQTPDTTVTTDPGGLGTVPPDTAVSPPVSDPAPVVSDPVMPEPVALDAASTALVGLSLDEATKVAEGNGWSVRVSTLDGEAQMLTDDYSPTRVNVAVAAGVVTGVDLIG